jgi:hypothetical protein
MQHVADRFVRIEVQGVATDIGPDPKKQDFAKERQDQAAKALVKSHDVLLRP